MSTPVSAVNSLLSSCKALAGSQAAQPRVNDSAFTFKEKNKANTGTIKIDSIFFMLYPPSSITIVNYTKFIVNYKYCN